MLERVELCRGNELVTESFDQPEKILIYMNLINYAQKLKNHSENPMKSEINHAQLKLSHLSLVMTLVETFQLKMAIHIGLELDDI